MNSVADEGTFHKLLDRITSSVKDGLTNASGSGQGSDGSPYVFGAICRRGHRMDTNEAFQLADRLRREEARLGRLEIEAAERAQAHDGGARPCQALSAAPVREVVDMLDA
jgi:hypothetical protein